LLYLKKDYTILISLGKYSGEVEKRKQTKAGREGEKGKEGIHGRGEISKIEWKLQTINSAF